MKGRLLKYNATKFQALNSHEFSFELTVEVGSIFKREKIVQFEIPNPPCNIKSYTDHWDNLIKSKNKFKIQ